MSEIIISRGSLETLADIYPNLGLTVNKMLRRALIKRYHMDHSLYVFTEKGYKELGPLMKGIKKNKKKEKQKPFCHHVL